MYHMSGAFVYQPPGELTPAGFQIALTLLNDDGSPVFPDSGELPVQSIWAAVVLSYPALLNQAPRTVVRSTTSGPPAPRRSTCWA
jgi:hypothetical protein